jgi:aspartyl-tRNA(Asn)/glutamyl-tRNA(Gln) amidotransferase subunit A
MTHTPESSELWQYSASRISSLLGSRQVSPVEVLQAVLERHERVNPIINAIVTLDAQGAHDAARASEQRIMRGERLSELDGVPVTIKDNIQVKGLRATWGSELYRDYVPQRDELAVARLRAAGAVIVGKTNTPEFALSGFTDNRLFGPTRNPWQTELTPGGSSGGAVAALAAGIAPLALGTDAGGSIRRPASYAGVVGFRPSTGRIARAYGFPPMAGDFQVIGPAARTVDDVALLFRHLSGPDPIDLTSLRAPPQGSGGQRPLRIRYLTSLGDAPIEPDIVGSVRDATAILKALGHQVVEGEAPYDVGNIDRIWATLSAAGLARVLTTYAGWRERIHPSLIAVAERGATVTGIEYAQALDAVTELRRTMAQEFEKYDVLATPTCASHPWAISKPYPHEINGVPVGPRGSALFSTFVNAAALPAISVPVKPSASGIPIGMQLVGRYGADETLLSLAAEFESAQPWASRWPEIELR